MTQIKKTLGIAGIIALVTMPVMADIASTDYVDSVKTTLNTSMSGKLSNTFEGKNMAVTTNGSGIVGTSMISTNMIAEGNVTNSKVATGIGIDKLALPTKCASGSCILIYNADTQTYVWENIGRVSGSSAPSGGVSGAGSSN